MNITNNNFETIQKGKIKDKREQYFKGFTINCLAGNDLVYYNCINFIK